MSKPSRQKFSPEKLPICYSATEALPPCPDHIGHLHLIILRNCNKMKNSLLIIVLCLFHCSWVHGQTGYSLRQYTAENGLPQNSIKSIAADSAGYIWLATEDGLVRFDGYHFTVFNSANLGIKSNRVISIRQSVKSTGNGTNSRPVKERANVFYVRFDAGAFGRMNSGIFGRIQNGQVVLDSLYYRNRANRLRSSQIGITNLNNVIFVAGVPDLLFSYPTDDDLHMIMAGGGEGNFFLIEKARVRYYSNWQKQYECKSPGPLLWNYFSIGKRLYYRHGNGTCSEISGNVSSTFKIEGIPYLDDDKKGKQKFYWNGNSEQAFLFRDNNLYIFEQHRDGKLSAKLLIKNFDLLGLEIDLLFYDTISQRVFLGSRVNGLYVLTKEQFHTTTIDGPNADNVFYAQLPYSRNTVLTPTGLLVEIGSSSSQNMRHLPAMARVDSADKRVIARDRDSTIWMRQWYTLLRLDHKTSKLTAESEFKSEIEGICTPTPGRLWIGTEQSGVYKLDLSSATRKPVRVIGSEIGKLTCIGARNESQVLVGTEKGLFVIETLTGKSRLIPASKGIHIASILPFSHGQAWVVGQGKGLMLLNNRDRLFTFPLDRDMFLSSAHCVVDDGYGFLWIPTNKGLFQIQKKDLFQYAQNSSDLSRQGNSGADSHSGPFYLYHSMEEGFATNEFNGSCQPCGVKLPNGLISLPSLKGLVWFDPGKIRPYVPDGGIILDKVEVDRKELKADGKTIAIPDNAETIKFFLSTAYFGHVANLDLSYAIIRPGQAIDSAKWVPLEEGESEIQISALRSGEYTLLVKKHGGFGLKNYSIQSFLLVFPKQWYENIWMMAALLILLVAMAVLATHAYNRHKLRTMMIKNIQLEEHVATRTEKLNQTLIGLEASRKDTDGQIHLLSRLVASISHDIQSPLRYISFASKKIPEMIQTKELVEASKVGTMIFDLSEHLGTMLGQIIDFTKIQVYGKKTHLQNVDVNQLVREKYQLFAAKIRVNKSVFENNIPVGQTIAADYQLLSIIIHNLLDNAAKYTTAGRIWVTFQLTDEKIPEIVIANSAGNIPVHIMDIINSRDNDQSLGELIDAGKIRGIGLIIVKEIAAIANISVTVSQTNQTYFYLRFPLSSSAR